MNVDLRLSQLKFRSGSTKDDDPLSVHLKNISVLVGPNNSGKSETLREIEGWTAPNLEQKLLQEVHMELPHSGEDTDSLFLRYKAEPAPGLTLLEGQIYVSYPYFNTTLEKVLSL